MVARNFASSNLIRLNRSNRTNWLAFLCLGISILIFLKSHNQLAKQEIVTPVVTEFSRVEIPVPAEPVPAGTRVKDLKLKRVYYPIHQVPDGALTELEPYTDFVSLTQLPANLPLFKVNFAESGAIANPVLDKIPLGMRAITIKVDATSAVEGWAGSGSIVDILLIEKNRSSVVAEKVKILSAERSVVPIEGQRAPTVPSTVTLLVTQEQCLAINTAIPLGRIAFALRSFQDDQSWIDPEFNAAELNTSKIESTEKGDIQGVISFKTEEKDKSFALTDGRWVKTEVMPQGFFVAGER